MEKTTIDDLGENWNKQWSGVSILQEFRTLLRDHVRAYVLKYLPRNGICVEAGSGLGRYVFYLLDLGVDIIGIDISSAGLYKCKNLAMENGVNPDSFQYGDIRKLSYPDGYFSAYLSFGVIEHFKEGPHDALREAFRVLRPGGIAIISTPNKFMGIVMKAGENLLSVFKGRKKREGFYEYEYTVDQLASFMEKMGFKIIEKNYICLKFPLYLMMKHLPYGLRILRLIQPLIFPLIDVMERTPLKLFSSGSLVVAYKPAMNPHCFFCGKTYISDEIKSNKFIIPVCAECTDKIPKKILVAYRLKGVRYNLRTSYRHVYTEESVESRECFFCGERYESNNRYFKNYGFSVSVCSDCLRDPIKNLTLSNFYLKYTWVEN